MSSYSTIQDHQSMILDDLRNSFYSKAIENAVKKNSVVLDLGAGLGLHGFMAANSGARKVYLVEPESIIDVTRQLVKANSLSDQVECIAGKIEEVELPEKVDVIISVFTGNFLLSEDLLPSLFYARDKHLSPGGKLIPDRATMEVVPICAPEYYEKQVDCWSNFSQVTDFNLVRRFAANSLYYDMPKNREAEFLSEPADLLDLDFMTATEASCHNKIEVEISKNGVCHGWLGWFRTRVGDEWLSTSPQEKQTHWRQVFLPLANPISVTKGEVLSFELSRPEFGEWSWTVGYNGKNQRHSTFLSEAVSPAVVHRKSDDYKPQLSQKGRAIQDVLSRMGSKQTTAKIVEYVLTEYQKLFPSRKQADRFVKNLVERYGS